MEFPHIISPKQIGSSSLDGLTKYLINHKPEIFLKIHEVGALLFRGFDLDSSDNFENIVKILTPSLSNYIGGDSPRTRINNNIYTSTEYPANETISMHHEKSFSNNHPKFVYFFCETAPIIGGETPILDSRKLYNTLDKNIVDKFATKKLKYVMNLHGGNNIGKSWQEVFETEDKDLLHKILSDLNLNYFWKPNGKLRIEEVVNPVIQHYITQEWIFFSQADQWHPSNLSHNVFLAMHSIMHSDDFYHNCYFADGSEIEEKDLSSIREAVLKEIVTFEWKRGDLLMLDNIISMHGRRPFLGSRKILVAMSS